MVQSGMGIAHDSALNFRKNEKNAAITSLLAKTAFPGIARKIRSARSMLFFYPGASTD